ncbi:hypothetical protein HanRHA438_Chr10g0458341 [Helianthus annuus]|uniref:uncharacterized protein LOC110882818 isoform X1 n=2 Tax=Helianthus annuus TaxID=4232 RepID=UPI0016530EFA|nr:uncharacterized protein LOC110882818 isoform X1 [Helianthus annuus]KAJ0514189.1 hypothetical protein HanHA300_Chr10g0366571 [Helianthus annuus]KAJ0700593.1 hypothetical protein HanOQP8_Chr10g0369541 [Helianthus annuus]KAJ0880032.1 hypothetical protein HanRHA438_Chr10g0458341 [Helianthus annuus]
MKTFSYGSDVALLVVDDGGCYGGCRQRDGGQAAMVLIHFRHVSDLGLGSSSPTRIGICRSLVILANLGLMRRRWCFQMVLLDWADDGATVIGEMECWWYCQPKGINER